MTIFGLFECPLALQVEWPATRIQVQYKIRRVDEILAVDEEWPFRRRAAQVEYHCIQCVYCMYTADEHVSACSVYLL